MAVLKFERPAPSAPGKPVPTSSKRKPWRHPTKEDVRAEAAYDEAIAGAPNVYTDYLKLYGRYPSPQQARAMGLKLGRRVRAEDGKFYPPKTAAEKQHDKEIRAERKEAYRVMNGVFAVQLALQQLVSVDATAEEIIAYCDGDGVMFNDDALIERDVDKALDLLQRFAVAWRARHPIKQDV